MKILGRSGLTRRYKEVPVGYSDGELLTLKVYAPRLGAVEKVYDEIPAPQAPLSSQVERDEKGNPVKDANGATVPRRNFSDPEYQKRLQAVSRARNLAILFICLEDQIEPETDRAAHADPVTYWEAVRAELAEAGFDVAVMAKLQNAAATVVDPSEVEFESARERLGAEGNELAGASSSGGSGSGNG